VNDVCFRYDREDASPFVDMPTVLTNWYSRLDVQDFTSSNLYRNNRQPRTDLRLDLTYPDTSFLHLAACAPSISVR
jgi:hypothetical protein